MFSLRIPTLTLRLPLLAAVLLAALAVLLAGDGLPVAQARTTTAYVSNIGQTHSSNVTLAQYQVAQGFTTGSETGGYALGSIEVYFSTVSGSTSVSSAELWSASSNLPGSKIADLTVPTTVSGGAANKFLAPANTTLAASTSYYVVIVGQGHISSTASDNEDSGAATGWSIADTSPYRNKDGTGNWQVWQDARRIRVNAEAGPTHLSGLTAEVSADGAQTQFTALTLNPEFAFDTTEYRAMVGNGLALGRVLATAADGSSTVRVRGPGGSFGQPGLTYGLQPGQNRFTVRVTDTDSNTGDYTVNIYRAGRGLLVSNLGQERFSRTSLTTSLDSQGFTTGSATAGYVLHSIDATFDVTGTVSAADAAKVKAELWSTVASGANAGEPDAKLYDLAAPSSISAGLLTFTAPANTVLAADTTYHLVLYLSSALSTGVDIDWTITPSKDEDNPSQAGWSIEDEGYSRIDIGGGEFIWAGSGSGAPLHISVNGWDASKSSNADLSGLAVRASSSAMDIDYFPLDIRSAGDRRFNIDTTDYDATVVNSIDYVEFTPTVAHSGATINHKTTETHPRVRVVRSRVVNGLAQRFPLDAGGKSFILEVTAENGVTTKDYTLTVTRLAQGVKPEVEFLGGGAQGLDEQGTQSRETAQARLSAALPAPTTVDLVLEERTATEGEDFTISSRTLRFPAGSIDASVVIQGIADEKTETAEETFFLDLEAVADAPYTLGALSRQEFVILDNSKAPGIYLFTDRDEVGEVTEGDTDTLTIVLGVAPSQDVTPTLTVLTSSTATQGASAD